MIIGKLIDILQELPDSTEVFIELEDGTRRGYYITGLVRSDRLPFANITCTRPEWSEGDRDE